MRAVRPSFRGAALLAVAALTYIAARALGTWELYFLAVALAAAVGVCWVLVGTSASRLEVTRTVLPDQPVAGDPLMVSVCVRNGSPVPGLQVTLDDAAGPLVAGVRTIDVPSLGPHAVRRLHCGPWQVRRGVHRLPPVTALAEDPLGLVYARHTGGEPLVLTVPPRLVPLESWELGDGAGRRSGGRRGRPPTVDASEFRGVRPHTPGEPLNRVDWKATARTGGLMLRELEDTGDGDVAVLFNAPGEVRDGDASGDDFELCVQAAGSIADAALRQGRGVTVVPAAGARPLSFSVSAADRRRLLTFLAGVKAGGLDQLGPSLRVLVAQARRRGRFRSLTLVLTSLDPSLPRAAAALRDEGTPLCAVLVGTAAGAAPELRAELEAAGARVVCVHAAADLAQALTAAPRRRRVLARR